MNQQQPGAAPDSAAAARDPELRPPFEIIEPHGPISPIVVSSPHSGSIYPARFLAHARLDALSLRRSEDAFVDELFGGAAAIGAPLLRARFPRAYLDVNREPYELDPRMFDGRLPSYVNTRSVRVAGGLGTIAKVVGESQEIYAGRLSVEDGLERIEQLYKPYHAALRRLLDRAHRTFGIAVLIDCHSMPSLPLSSGADRRNAADFVVGDRYGTSSHPAFVHLVEQAITGAGFVVQRNKPYAGGFITEHYGAPDGGIHAVQIEINRSLYMNEKLLIRLDGFAKLQETLAAMMQRLAEAALAQVTRKAAAE